MQFGLYNYAAQSLVCTVGGKNQLRRMAKKVIDNKTSRQQTLLRLLEDEILSSQEDVVRRMQECGYVATQPSISRDFRELGIVKLSGRYVCVPREGQQRYARREPQAEVNPWMLIRSLSPAGAHMLVARTEVGAAALVATELDKAGLRDIVGTIAGDDTVFIAVPGEAAQRRIEQRLRIFGVQLNPTLRA